MIIKLMNTSKVQNKRNINKSGFTLVETFVAILILTFSIAGPLSIAQKGLSSAYLAKDKVIASYLAQDAVEWVRYVRDSFALTGTDPNTLHSWMLGDGSTSFAQNCIGQVCYIDTLKPFSDPDSAFVCSGTCPVMYRDDNDPALPGVYGYSGTATTFVRTVNVTFVNDDEANVFVTVSWKTGSHERTFELNEHLFLTYF